MLKLFIFSLLLLLSIKSYSSDFNSTQDNIKFFNPSNTQVDFNGYNSRVEEVEECKAETITQLGDLVLETRLLELLQLCEIE